MAVGSQYPTDLSWPSNVQRVEHLTPRHHPEFYSRQRFTLNLTRLDMRAAGHAPSVRLFEAAACGTPIISDAWPGIEEVLVPGEEVLIAHTSDDVVGYLQGIDGAELRRMAQSAREHVIAAHCGERRASELESYIESVSRLSPVPTQNRSAHLEHSGAIV
jgi:spore maturation protein CgeB